MYRQIFFLPFQHELVFKTKFMDQMAAVWGVLGPGGGGTNCKAALKGRIVMTHFGLSPRAS